MEEDGQQAGEEERRDETDEGEKVEAGRGGNGREVLRRHGQLMGSAGNACLPICLSIVSIGCLSRPAGCLQAVCKYVSLSIDPIAIHVHVGSPPPGAPILGPVDKDVLEAEAGEAAGELARWIQHSLLSAREVESR